ncbi:Zinc finger, CCCH-type [Parasponia andersonii]|uniref:Zinc finger, CCCH-type n=1 Tax=Parasponia andersonii TaxID=3476 RepID=A0A2P5DW28_PARAD|nr:Zinc finger, CCCH-type [Parasponia andersonii]
MESDAFSPQSETNTASPNSPRFAAMAASTCQNFLDVSPETRDFGTNFFSLYRAIFQSRSPQIPSSLSLTPSTRSPSSAGGDDNEISTEHRLKQARRILEQQELNDYCDLIEAHLNDLSKDIDYLRRENAELRSVNGELLKLISSPAAFRGFLLSSTNQSLIDRFRRLDLGGVRTTTSTHDVGHGGSEDFSDISPTSVMETNRFERRNPDPRVSLPKSISVRSTGYQKANQPAGSSREGPSRGSTTRPRAPTSTVSGTQRVYVPGVSGSGGGDSGSSSSGGMQKEVEEENMQGGVELEVFNQGMFKTELCNKWEETGACPYGDHCQFAHGMAELRPVIRHPRYKTEICRMVLAGDRCPYGHRCHFRHSLTELERLMLPR